MKISGRIPVHLSYCLNVHGGETWAENLDAIRSKTLAVRDRVSPGEPFGLGLRLSREAAKALWGREALERALEFFRAEKLYAFTINGFPYGRFHGPGVKENVYLPDWRDPDRRDYTLQLADILEALLPEGGEGSISTVPCGFKGHPATDADIEGMTRNLVECVRRLAQIRQQSGKTIHLGLEPEPGCILETTVEAVEFFEASVFTDGVSHLAGLTGDSRQAAEEHLRRHLGICFDTCHVAVAFEDPLEALRMYGEAGIRISKAQISAALAVTPGPEAAKALLPFDEPVYLHQVKIRDHAGSVTSWDDLPPAFPSLEQAGQEREARIHFHIPLFFDGTGELRSTARILSRPLLEALAGATNHWEIETYTFDVLPRDLRPATVEESVAREFAWLLKTVG